MKITQKMFSDLIVLMKNIKNCPESYDRGTYGAIDVLKWLDITVEQTYKIGDAVAAIVDGSKGEIIHIFTVSDEIVYVVNCSSPDIGDCYNCYFAEELEK